MTCPKCEKGTIKKVILKMNGETALLCDACETLWFEDEEIKMSTGIPFDVTSQGDSIEYTIEPIIEKDPENTQVTYTHAK